MVEDRQQCCPRAISALRPCRYLHVMSAQNSVAGLKFVVWGERAARIRCGPELFELFELFDLGDLFGVQCPGPEEERNAV